MRNRFYLILAGFVSTAFVLAGMGATAAQASHTPPRPTHLPAAVNLHHVAQVSHGSPKITIPRKKKSVINRAAIPLQYHGGPVQRDPQLYVLFWGSWWLANPNCSGSPNNGGADETYLYNFYHGMGSSSDTLSPVASQYYGPTGNFPLYPTVAGKGFIQWNVDCTNPPTSATDAQLAAEAVSYATYLASSAGGSHAINNNTQIIVVSPSGTNPGGGFGSSYCAYHNWAQYSSTQLISWTNMPYMPDQGSNCGANLVSGPLDGWSIVGGHELTESVTDPFVNNQSAWYDSSGQEIGDKCAWVGLFSESMSTGSFAMQPEFDNHTLSCKRGPTNPFGQLKLAANTTLCPAAALTSGSAVTLFSPCDTNYARTWTRYTDQSLRRYRNTGVCMEPKSGLSTNGTPIVVYRCAETSVQKWVWSSSTGEWKDVGTQKCLTAATAASGAALTESTCVGGATQKFANV